MSYFDDPPVAEQLAQLAKQNDKKRTLVVKMSAQLYEDLRRQAEKNEMSMATYVRKLLIDESKRNARTIK